ncbi:MAG: septal ring lytic transglycosylase RlpA family protein [Rhizobiales bacterium]|nr:septal ring lytic transglycosylase RlpA family protein [Hyphomicrobiales bacterium]
MKTLSVLCSTGVVVGASLAVTGCSTGKQDPFAGTGSPMYTKAGPLPKGGGRRHIGKPYEIAGIKFYPKADPGYDKTGVASWYGPKFHKRMTSNGEWFDMNYPSAAHTTLPLPSYAKVTNLDNGRELIVRVNDRGPFVDDRIIDLSKHSAEVLDVKHKGTGQVRVQYIGPAPLDDQGSHLMAMNDQLKQGTPLHRMIAAVDGKNAAPGANQPGYLQTASIAKPAAGGFFVQVAAFSEHGNAQRTQARLRDLGPVVVTPVSASIGTIYRVQMGPLADESTAHNVLSRVVDAGHHDARVVRNSQY